MHRDDVLGLLKGDCDICINVSRRCHSRGKWVKDFNLI